MEKTTRCCALCGDEFQPARANVKFCGRPCATALRAGLDAPVCCADCGKRMELGRGSRTDGTGRCIACRKAEPTHGVHRYARHGCRCEACTEAIKIQARRFNAKHREKHGVAYATLWKRRFKDEYGFWPNAPGGWISRRRRAAIYERDGWSCHLCGQPVSREYDAADPLSPTLDHLVPRSAGGSDESGNLATAHAVCNARRGARPVEAFSGLVERSQATA